MDPSLDGLGRPLRPRHGPERIPTEVGDPVDECWCNCGGCRVPIVYAYGRRDAVLFGVARRNKNGYILIALIPARLKPEPVLPIRNCNGGDEPRHGGPLSAVSAPLSATRISLD